MPTPVPDTQIKDIVKFKQKRNGELLQFRAILDQAENDINSIEDNEERKLKMIQFQERIQIELIEIRKLLGDSRLEFVFNSFSSLLEFKKKELEGTAVGLVLAKVGLATSLPLIGFAAGAVTLATTLISSYRKINRQVESSSSSYIYFAQKEGILTQ